MPHTVQAAHAETVLKVLSKLHDANACQRNAGYSKASLNTLLCTSHTPGVKMPHGDGYQQEAGVTSHYLHLKCLRCIAGADETA